MTCIFYSFIISAPIPLINVTFSSLPSSSTQETQLPEPDKGQLIPEADPDNGAGALDVVALLTIRWRWCRYSVLFTSRAALITYLYCLTGDSDLSTGDKQTCNCLEVLTPPLGTLHNNHTIITDTLLLYST